MRSILEKRLDTILESDVTQVDEDPFQTALSLYAELDAARRKVSDLERQWMYAVDRLNGGLAMGIRKHKPALNIGLDGGCCKVGYRTKHMRVKPDLQNKVWTIDGDDPRFIRRFMKKYGPQTGLTNDLNVVAKAISDFFTGHYRSIGEDIVGTGLLIMNGRKVGLQYLAEYVNACDDHIIDS